MNTTWTIRTSVLLVLLLAVTGASLSWVAHGVFLGGPEAARTLQASRGLLPAGDGPALGSTSAPRSPGLPALLAPMIHVVGFHVKAYTLLVHLFGILVVTMLFLGFRRRIGDFPAMALALVTWMHPTFRILCNAMLPAVPAAALLLTALVINGHARRTNRASTEILLGALIAAAAAVSTHAILALPAVLLSRAAAPDAERAGSRRVVLSLLTAVLLLVPLTMTSLAPTPADAPPHTWEALRVASTAGPDLPLAISADDRSRASNRAAWAVSTLGHRLRDTRPDTAATITGVVLVAALAVTAVRRRGAHDFFALLFLAVFCFLPGRSGLELLSVYFIALAAAIDVTRMLLRRVPGLPLSDLLLTALILFLGATDARARFDWAAHESRHQRRVEDAAELDQRLPTDLLLAAYVRPYEEVVYLNRPVIPLEESWREGASAVMTRLDAEGVDAVILRGGSPLELHEVLAGRFVRESLGPRLVLYGPETVRSPDEEPIE